MSRLEVMDFSGHTTLEWEVDDKEALANAEAAFNEAIKMGGLGAFELDEDAQEYKSIRKFNPKAKRIVMAPRLIPG
jgi:hypothetical protein